MAIHKQSDMAIGEIQMIIINGKYVIQGIYITENNILLDVAAVILISIVDMGNRGGLLFSW